MAVEPERRMVSMWRFPGVWTLAVGFVQAFIGYTWPLYWWALLLRSIMAEFKWSAALLGAGLSIGQGAGIAGGFLGGWSVDRWGPVWPGVFFSVLMGLAFVGFTGMTELWQYFVLFGIATFSMWYGTYRVSYPAANRWWVERRAMAIAIVTLGGGMGAIIGPWGAALLQAYGWRMMCWFAAVSLIVICGGVSFLYPNRMPERYGLYADNLSPEERRRRAEARSRAVDTRPPLIDIGVSDAVRTWAFWGMMLASLVSATMYPFTQFQNIAMGAKGYSLVEAAIWMTMNQVMTYVGRLTTLFFGDWLNRRLGVRYVFATAYISAGIGLIAFAIGTQAWHYAVWALFYGFGFGLMVPYIGVFIGAYFGRTSYGTIFGIRYFAYNGFSTLTPVIAGWLADTMSWTEGVLFMAVGALLCGVILVFTTPPPQQLRERRR